MLLERKKEIFKQLFSNVFASKHPKTVTATVEEILEFLSDESNIKRVNSAAERLGKEVEQMVDEICNDFLLELEAEDSKL